MDVYLDNNASAPVRPEAAQSVLAAIEAVGNPSAVHRAGRELRAIVEESRRAVATLIGTSSGRVLFTSGGTEANSLALLSAARSGVKRFLIGATEHPSVRECALALEGQVEVWPVTSSGEADLDWLRQILRDWRPSDGPPFVALMLANNETGVIQPVEIAAELVAEVGGWLHVDAVQAAGKIAISMDALGARTMAISAHKLGGLTGSGALVVAPGTPIKAILHGGGQEFGLRAGTENVAGIAAFGAAARASVRDLPLQSRQHAWREAIEADLQRAHPVVVVGKAAKRLPGTLCMAVQNFESSLQVMGLDLEGVRVSAGAACSAGKLAASHVVSMMGLRQLARSSLRVSGGWSTNEEDWRIFSGAWQSLYRRYAALRR